MRRVILAAGVMGLVAACGAQRPPPSSADTITLPGAPLASPAPGGPQQWPACGRTPGQAPVKALDGITHTPTCNRIATQWANLPAADRACETDADCVVFTDDARCHATTLTRRAAPRYTPPCGRPDAGPCGGGRVPAAARCSHGCCVLPDGGFGDLVHTYVRARPPPDSDPLLPTGGGSCHCGPNDRCCGGGMPGHWRCVDRKRPCPAVP